MPLFHMTRSSQAERRGQGDGGDIAYLEDLNQDNPVGLLEVDRVLGADNVGDAVDDLDALHLVEVAHGRTDGILFMLGISFRKLYGSSIDSLTV